MVITKKSNIFALKLNQFKNMDKQKSTPVTPLLSSASVADELTKLAKLKESGILSEEEFNAQKSKLLNL